MGTNPTIQPVQGRFQTASYANLLSQKHFFEPNWQDFPVQYPKHALTVHGWGCSQGCTKPVTPGNSKLQLRDELTAVAPPPHIEECYEQCLSFFYRSCSPSKKERLTLLRRKFGNNLLLVRYKPQQGQLLLFPKCVMIHMQQKLCPHEVKKASFIVCMQMGHKKSLSSSTLIRVDDEESPPRR